MRHRLLTTLLLAFSYGAACGLSAARGEDFYKGKTITLIVGNGTGGGYDLYARVLARYWPKYIPGEPNIVVRNQPGAGGMVMSNALYTTTARDGLTIGMMSRSNPIEPFLGSSAAKFKSEDFTWIGTSSSYEEDAYCLIIRADSPVLTIADAAKTGKPLIFGGLAAGGTDTDLVLIARDVFKLNAQLIRGYHSSPDINLAIQRGEVEGRAIGMTSLVNTMTEWLHDKKVRILMQFGHEQRWSGLPDVPTARELATRPDDRSLLELAELPFLMARPFVAPPGIPPELAAILKRSFMAAHQDPDYVREAKQMQLDVSPRNGDDIQKIISRIAQTPPSLFARYNAILASK